MLVINANNQQDTTNYMVGGPEYPDVEQILMYGGPTRHYVGSYQPGNVSFPTIKTIGSTNINYYCPKIYRQGLLQGNFANTDMTSGPKQVDISYYATGTTGTIKILGGISYVIAVSRIPAGKIIGEHIFASLGFYVGGTYGMDGRTIKFNSSSGQTRFAFSLLGSDGTKRDIVSFAASYLGGMEENGTYNLLSRMNRVAIRGGRYDGTGLTSQEGDTLIATVSISDIYNDGSGFGNNMTAGISYGGTNNNNFFDLNGFRPFQVSIRDA